jgi:hypothetical protein
MAESKDPPMQEPLEQLLVDLKAAIEASEDGADNRDELARLVGEVERRLHEEDDEGVVDDLRDEVTRFEVSHPHLSSAIGRAADALSALGL